MAAVADYGTVDPEKGIYGIYNDFFVRITTNTVGTKYKRKYRIRTTMVNDTSIQFVRDVEPDSNNIIQINPVAVMQTAFFKNQTIGGDGGFALDDPEETDVADKSLNKVQVEIGEVYADVATDPPTFRGYDTDNTFWFYNGFEEVKRTPITGSYLNYRNRNWYDMTPIKLPYFNLNKRFASSYNSFFAKIYFPSEVLASSFTYTPLNYRFVSYDDDGNIVSDTTINISSAFSTDGYWSDFLVSGISSGSAECWIEYDNGAGGTQDSEKLVITPRECTKNQTFLIGYINRFGVRDYQDFNGVTNKSQNIQRGKIINTGGLLPNPSSFGSYKYPTKGETENWGDSVSEIWTMNTGWITQDEVESLKDLYRSKNNIIVDPSGQEFGEVYPVRVLDNTYRIINTKDELAQVQVRFELANPPKIQLQ